MLDQTDFGHTVGKVELETHAMVNDGEAERILAEMDKRIVGFLERYNDAFSDEAPVGKLTAYLCQSKQTEQVTD